MWETLLSRDGMFFLVVLRWLVALAVLGVIAATWRGLTRWVRVLFHPNRKAIRAVQQTLSVVKREGNERRIQDLHSLTERLLCEKQLPDFVLSGRPAAMTSSIESYFAACREAEAEQAKAALH